MNTLMLTLAVRFGKGRINPVRVMLGAVCGAAIARASGGLSRLQAMLLWLPTAMIMMRIAMGKSRNLPAQTLLLICASGLVGGMVLCFMGATGSLAAAYALGILAAVAAGFCAAKTRRTNAARVRVICVYRGRRAAFEAMIDSGNTLVDYLTHLPVIVIPEKTGYEALGLEDAVLRPIFAQTAGGRQRMAVLAPQEVTLELDGIGHGVQAVIALSPGMDPATPALVPAALEHDNWNSNRGG